MNCFRVKTLIIAALVIAGVLLGRSPAHSTTMDLTLTPSASQLTTGEAFTLDVWATRGNDLVGDLFISSLEFNVQWDTPAVSASFTGPSLGGDVLANDPWGLSQVSSLGSHGVNLSIAFFHGLEVGTDGVILTSIPLLAGELSGPAALSFDFFMESKNKYSVWLEDGGMASGLDLSAVSAVGAEVNIQGSQPAPEPASLLLMGSGLLFLSSRVRKRI